MMKLMMMFRFWNSKEHIHRTISSDSWERWWWRWYFSLSQLEDARDLRDSRLRVLRESRERLARLARKTNKTMNDDSKLASKMYAAEREKVVPMVRNNSNSPLHASIVSGQNYSWSDKYRPRKPRFFNRVKTGYEWNKYNQQRDSDTSRSISKSWGSKFKSLATCLIDSSKCTGQYFLEACAEYTFVFFIEGAKNPVPNILNKEWMGLLSTGFRCVFERGISGWSSKSVTEETSVISIVVNSFVLRIRRWCCSNDYIDGHSQ